MLESYLKEDNSFVTLTYADDYWEKKKFDGYNGLPTLLRSDLQKFLKRLRWKIDPISVRYFAAGEYDDNWRPHFHLALFGYPNCLYGQSRYSRIYTQCCAACETIRETWGHGHVFLGALERKSAQYIAGYVVKKLTRSDDPRLEGRSPEFAAMSLRPGIGAMFMENVGTPMFEYLMSKGDRDVPESLRHGSKLLPLGRYLRHELRGALGWEKKAKRNAEREIQMLRMLKASSLDPESSLKKEIQRRSKSKIASLEAREMIFKKRGKL